MTNVNGIENCHRVIELLSPCMATRGKKKALHKTWRTMTPMCIESRGKNQSVFRVHVLATFSLVSCHGAENLSAWVGDGLSGWRSFFVQFMVPLTL